MVDYRNLIAFLNKVSPSAEDVLRFKNAYQSYTETGEWKPVYQVFTSGWQEIDGVMLLTPDTESEVDYCVYLTAKTERSLRELLLAFPRKCVGMFSISEEWIEKRIGYILDGDFVRRDSRRYFRGIKRGSQDQAEHRTISKRKDTVVSHIRTLSSVKGKLEKSQYIVEGEMMVNRAVTDGLPIETVLYTANFVSTSDGKEFVKEVFDDNLSCYLVSDGVMGSLTSTRPVPSILASVYLTYPHFLCDSGGVDYHYSNECTLLITENIVNPDNLGMTLRTADAAGVSAVLVCGEGASPFHKNCVRASRGAIGRLPLFFTPTAKIAIEQLMSSGWQVLGATASAKNDVYSMDYSLPTAVVVGNENSGLFSETRECCTELIRIPMATGQSSLNVGVAAGILLYELTRQRLKWE